MIDTNIVSAYLKGDVSVERKMNQTTDVFIPVIVIGELCFGAALSENNSKYLADINRLKAVYRIILADIDYGSIKAALRKKENQYLKMIFGLLLLQYNIILQ